MNSLGKVAEVRSSAEASVSHNTDRNADIRVSKTSLRTSKENPIVEEDERVEVGPLEKARNTADHNPVKEEGEDEYYDEEEEYDEEYEEDFDKSRSS
jgi:hypothetical protein